MPREFRSRGCEMGWQGWRARAPAAASSSNVAGEILGRLACAQDRLVESVEQPQRALPDGRASC
jgi:hypothetical protein